MKKIFLLCLVCVLVLCSCGEPSYSSLQLAEKIQQEFPTLVFSGNHYNSKAHMGEASYMTSRLQSLLYDEGRMRLLPEFETVVDYAVWMGQGLQGGEVHIFRLQDTGDVRSMENLLSRRVTLLKRRSLYLFAPDVYESRLASAMVTSVGNYVLLLATDQNEEVLSYITKLVS